MTPQEKATQLYREMPKPCALRICEEILLLKHPVVIVHSETKDNEINEMTQEYYWEQVYETLKKL